MRRPVLLLLLALIAGALAGALLMRWHGGRRAAGPEPVVRDLVATSAMPDAVAQAHRSENFRSLDSVPQIFELPSAFARSEALHALAGRSDAAELQEHIFAADRIADDIEREQSLATLFFRLAELDPPSALALARTGHFRDQRGFEYTVWSAWARMDFEEALFAAKTQGTSEQRNTAAQALYAAFGSMGNERTDRIEQELGIRPDRAQRARFLYRLADESPAGALAWVESMQGTERAQYASWLADYLARTRPAAAQQLFRAAAEPGTRQVMAHRIVAALAESDPAAAIAWARANHDPFVRDRSLEMTAIAEAAQWDPELAFAEALRNQGGEQGYVLVSMVVSRVAESDPALAVSFLERIDDPLRRREAESSVAQTWFQRDVDEALAWIGSLDAERAQQLIDEGGMALIYADTDAAMQLLPRVGPGHQPIWRQQIAHRLASAGSAEEALAFVRQFESDPQYAELQGSVIGQVAQYDLEKARRLVDQVPGAAARDVAHQQIVYQQAHSDPQRATELLAEIADESLRAETAAAVAQTWMNSDPTAAGRWLLGLPAGRTRDYAIARAVQTGVQPPGDLVQLMDSIADRALRVDAKVGYLYQLSGSDPAEARRRLADPDIPDYAREEIDATLRQMGY